MKLDEISDLYLLISRGTENATARKLSMKLRKSGLNSIVSDTGFTKVAFDTRRINQETEMNPRGRLQNYNRSEALQMREDYATGNFTYEDISSNFGIKKDNAYRIINRKIWRHI